jgi:hypothetical protein
LTDRFMTGYGATKDVDPGAHESVAREAGSVTTNRRSHGPRDP